MKEQSKNIEIGRGIDAITFGMTRQEVEQIAGKPSEKETYPLSDEENDMAETWHYDELDISISFEEAEDWLLTSISVSSPDYLLDGKQLIGKNFDQVVEELEKMELGEIEVEDSSPDDGINEKVLSIDESGLNFWFENGILTEIQWNPLWPEEDEDE
ncbi:MAG: hypothetical protein Q8907_10070 [Bacteroidota bacterium]|nr:hypothetical protein [Bacteroidota bacterium]MDP4225266.1 hypothetical protein [Bacteroidota bacterium]MDP4274612.1 hypothetical protein [Bacteroidota bacterium]